MTGAPRKVALAALTILAVLLALQLPALAQSPFAMPGGEAPPPEPGFVAGLMRSIMAMQQEYYRALAGAFRAVNLQGSLAAAWGLVSISFLYGVFHAAGPGHGKVIVTSWLLADERDLKRGILIAFLSAFAQAVTAILVVGILAVALGMTQRATADIVPIVERASFLLIAGVGAWLLWRAFRPAHHHHHDHAHDHDPGHAHLPAPKEIRGVRGLKGMIAVILSVGLRPCSGAILVLLFSVTQGAFHIGALSAFAMSVGTAITVSGLALLTVASKNGALRLAGKIDSPWTLRLERTLRIAGGAFILLFGLFLLVGSFTLPRQPLF
ncbi:MAG: nickel/cobalt transporter [Parvibaculum sp.]|uniref:nickel/cobalt transporter n=1 Tax=Parvibaculum sp. TaxID=2024848 RepID=UPI00271B9F43|nr:nickel/cobalt transporter [Parvibaculum sp.]MDO8839292.1 nickel/cobalt transporter [Parvibaculum sp.]